MKRTCIAVVLLVFIIGVVGCSSPSPPETFPKMNATEVCRYVNQALPNEYVYRTPALRYEYRYTALSAQYIGGSNYYEEGVWEVNVRETVESQGLYEGQWTPFPETSGLHYTVSQTVKYIFNEATGAVTRQ